jgi:hypothetical protein
MHGGSLRGTEERVGELGDSGVLGSEAGFVLDMVFVPMLGLRRRLVLGFCMRGE